MTKFWNAWLDKINKCLHVIITFPYVTDFSASESRQDVADVMAVLSSWSLWVAEVRIPTRKVDEGDMVTHTASMTSSSSGRDTFTGSPLGWWETQSVAQCLTPGTWIIRNLYLSVLSFKFLRRELEMSSRQMSPNIFRRGLWSTATMRYVQPNTKYLALLNGQKLQGLHLPPVHNETQQGVWIYYQRV